MACSRLGLGLWKLATAIRARHPGEQASSAAARGLTGVAGLTTANGGDNLAAYTPVFVNISAGATAVTVAVFAVGVGCGASPEHGCAHCGGPWGRDFS